MPEIFPVASILLSACLYGWSDPNVPLIHLTIIGLFQEIMCNIHSVIFIGGTSHSSSYYALNLASYNWTVSFKYCTCTCLMLFPRGNLKMQLNDKHQRGTNFTSRMPILKRTYCRTFYSSFYMVYGLSKWFILHFTLNGPKYFFSSSRCIGCWTSIILSSVSSYIF